jgi:hypothetical protein
VLTLNALNFFMADVRDGFLCQSRSAGENPRAICWFKSRPNSSW